MKNLLDGIELTAYRMFVPFTFDRETLVSALKGADVAVREEKDGRIMISSEIFQCSVQALIVFCFSGNRLSGVDIAPMLAGDDDYETFPRIQRELRDILGAPANPFNQVLNWMDKRNWLYKWCVPQGEITHCLEDRFGLTETISIRFSAAFHARGR